MTFGTYVVLVVEDELSAAVMGKLINDVNPNLVIDRTINTRGCGDMKKGMEKWKNGSKGIPHILLTDLDKYECPVHLISDWGAKNLPEGLLFRVAKREVEAWLLGDSSGIADFLGVAKIKIPVSPEDEKDPKNCILELARRSKKKRLAAELVTFPLFFVFQEAGFMLPNSAHAEC